MLYGELPQVTLEDGSIVNGLTVHIPSPKKSAIVRLPTALEIIERLDQDRDRDRPGRRKANKALDLKPDLWLFKRVRLDKGEEFDEYEAASVINKITTCETTDCDRVGDNYEIKLKTPFGETVHTLSIPTQKAIMEFRRGLANPNPIERTIVLFNSVTQGFSGYAPSFTTDEIPPNHKSAVVFELITALDDLDPVIDPNF